MSMNQEQEKAKVVSPTAKSDRLKEIEELYQSQIKQVYNESKEAIKEREKDLDLEKKQSNFDYSSRIKKVSSITNLRSEPSISKEEERGSRIYRSPANESRIAQPISNLTSGDSEKLRASVFLQGESTRTIEILRKENESKELKIRELTNKCESLIGKLKNHLSPTELEEELVNLKEFSEKKSERLENLFKIKSEEIFFKMKLQIIGLLQEFQVSKEDISGINEVNNESGLYSFMARKLKLKLKDFRSKEQESNFEIQRDKILNQKYEERIHYLIETNELFKLSETKLKGKIEELKRQMNQFLDRIKEKEKEVEERESEVFRLKKQNEELHSTNQKLNHKERNIMSEKSDEKKIFEAKEKEMKALLSTYFLERKKLEGSLEEKEGELEEALIREKFLQQENERINREFVRWKERYEWLEKEKENRQKEYEEEKAQIMFEFEQYKNDNNQGVYLSCRTDTDEALRKVEEYQLAYQKLVYELSQEKDFRFQQEKEAEALLEESTKEWIEKIKRMEKLKEEEMYELAEDHENRQREIREEYEKRQTLLGEEMEARMKALLAERDKKSTEKLIQVENDNEDLRKEIETLQRNIEARDSLLNALNKAAN